MRGWLASLDGDFSGNDEMLQAVNDPASSALRTILLTLMAERQVRAGQLDAAIGTLDRAMIETRIRFYEAEAVRLRGEILLAQSPANTGQAEATFRQSMALAAAQSCRATELRAGTSLARLLADSGRTAEARDVLAPVYGAFTEGFGWPDLQAAKTLLDTLS